MSANPSFLDDLGHLAGNALNIAGGLKGQIKDEVRCRIEDMASNMDLVPREDLDQALAMIEKLRTEMGDMDKRLKKLEQKK